MYETAQRIDSQGKIYCAHTRQGIFSCEKMEFIGHYSETSHVVLATVRGHVQSVKMKHNPDIDKLTVWAGTGCMAVSPIYGLSFIFPPCTNEGS